MISGRITSFIALILISAIVLYNLLKTTTKLPSLRQIAGINAIEESVKRCAEMGRPVHFTLGIGGLTGSDGAQTIAALGVMSYVTNIAAQLNVESIVTLCQLQVVPAAEEIVRTNYAINNAEFKPTYVRYTGNNQAYLSIAIQGIMDREKPGANFMMGLFDEEAISIAEKGYRSGSIGIGATATIGQMGILAATMDYFLIGEELFAVGAYLSKDRTQTMSIASIDIWKIVTLVVTLGGVILLNAGSDIIKAMLEL